MTRLVGMTGLLAMACLSAACGSEVEERATRTSSRPPSPSPSITATPSPTSSPRTGTVVITADSEYGRMLYDSSGQPIYLFDAESSSRPACYGECAVNWPPVLTNGLPRGRTGVNTGLLGTTRRKDGSQQVTYAGHPLYHYAHEGKYEVRCHDVEEYGGTWLVVQPDGRPAPG